MRRTIGSARGDARGEAPCMKITLISPFPPGRGDGGDGGSKASQRQGWQATNRASHPLGTANARRSGDLPDKPPAGHLQRRFSPCRFRLGRGDARGEAPCMKITLISPLPRRGRALCERGRGDGEKKASQRQGWQATNRASHPLGTCTAGTISAVDGSVQGCRGRSPRRNKLWDSPFPGGEGGRGDGGSKAS